MCFRAESKGRFRPPRVGHHAVTARAKFFDVLQMQKAASQTTPLRLEAAELYLICKLLNILNLYLLFFKVAPKMPPAISISLLFRFRYG